MLIVDLTVAAFSNKSFTFQKKSLISAILHIGGGGLEREGLVLQYAGASLWAWLLVLI